MESTAQTRGLGSRALRDGRATRATTGTRGACKPDRASAARHPTTVTDQGKVAAHVKGRPLRNKQRTDSQDADLKARNHHRTRSAREPGTAETTRAGTESTPRTKQSDELEGRKTGEAWRRTEGHQREPGPGNEDSQQGGENGSSKENTAARAHGAARSKLDGGAAKRAAESGAR